MFMNLALKLRGNHVYLEKCLKVFRSSKTTTTTTTNKHKTKKQ